MNHEATHHETAPRALATMTFANCVCILLVLALGVGKITGTVDPLVARRGVGAMLGLILMATGNFVPKLRLFQSAPGATPNDAMDRFAGWTFVLCGLASAIAFLWAPADRVFIVPPLIVMAGFLAVLARWLMGQKQRPSRLSLPLTPGRVALATLLAAVLWTCAIFLVDAFWGDGVSRWMAILFPFILIWLAAIRARSA